jgi:fucose permease
VAPPTISASSWRTALFATFFLCGVGVATFVTRIPRIRDDLGISVADVGVVIFAMAAGSILGLLLASHLVHWIGGRRTVRGTMVTFASGLMITGIGASVLHSYPVTLGGLALFGFSSAICDVATNVEGTGVERATNRHIMPWLHASWSVGTIIGAIIGAGAAFAHVEPALHLGIAAAVIGTGGVIATRWIPALAPPEEGDGPRPNLRSRMAIWLEPRTLLIGVIVLGMAFAEGAAGDWLALAMIDDRGLDNGQGALLFGVFAVAMTVGRIAGVRLLNRFGRIPVLRVSTLAAILGLSVIILVPIVPIAVLGIVIWGLGTSLGFPVGMSAAGDDPVQAGARVGAVATIAYSAFLVGPPVIGFVGEHIGLLNALWIIVGMIAIAGLASPAARKHDSDAT